MTTAQTAADAADVVVATMAAGTKMEAIGKEAGIMEGRRTDADAGLGGSTTSAIMGEREDEGAYALSIERDRMATTVTITVQGATEDDDVEFMEAMDLDDGRTMHTRTMDADARRQRDDRSRDRPHRHRSAQGGGVREVAGYEVECHAPGAGRNESHRLQRGRMTRLPTPSMIAGDMPTSWQE